MARKHPQAASELQSALALLAEDAFHPQLKTHKLKGKLAGSWACSTGYDLRVVFGFVRHKGPPPTPLPPEQVGFLRARIDLGTG